MPLPTKGQSFEDYMKGFMSDPAMVEKYPDEKQRYVVGKAEWDKSHDMACDKEEEKDYFIPPEAGDAPQAVKNILKAVYDKLRGDWVKAHPNDKENEGNKTSSSQQAWAAVKNAGWKKDKDGKWVKANSEELETVDIKDRIIFSAGTWNGDTYTDVDIKALAESFNELKDQIRPPLKFGHNDGQKMADGFPAIGWVDNVRAVGKNLVADLIKVPKKVYELISKGAYRTVSPEIYWDLELNGKKYPYALKALALLGADLPACKNVSDIMALYSEVYAYADEPGEVKAYTVNTEEHEMEIKELETKLAEAEKALEAKTAEFSAKETGYAEDKAKSEASIKELSEKLNQAEAEKRKAELTAYTDKLIADKHILPAAKDSVYALLDSMTIGAKTYKEKPIVEMFKSFAESLKVELPSDETTDKGDKETDITEAAKKYAEENKVSFRVALKAISKNKENK